MCRYAEKWFEEQAAEEAAAAEAEYAAWAVTPEGLKLLFEQERARLRADLAGAEQERLWSTDYPAEWKWWLKVRDLLVFEFGGVTFPAFLEAVGKQRTKGRVLRRKDPSKQYTLDNLRWVKKKPRFTPGNTPYLTYKQVVREFGIPKTRLYELRRTKKVECVKVPGVGYRFTRSGLERFVKDHTVAAETPTKAPTKLTPAARRPPRKTAPPVGPRFKYL